MVRLMLLVGQTFTHFEQHNLFTLRKSKQLVHPSQHPPPPPPPDIPVYTPPFRSLKHACLAITRFFKAIARVMRESMNRPNGTLAFSFRYPFLTFTLPYESLKRRVSFFRVGGRDLTLQHSNTNSPAKRQNGTRMLRSPRLPGSGHTQGHQTKARQRGDSRPSAVCPREAILQISYIRPIQQHIHFPPWQPTPPDSSQHATPPPLLPPLQANAPPTSTVPLPSIIFSSCTLAPTNLRVNKNTQTDTDTTQRASNTHRHIINFCLFLVEVKGFVRVFSDVATHGGSSLHEPLDKGKLSPAHAPAQHDVRRVLHDLHALEFVVLFDDPLVKHILSRQSEIKRESEETLEE